MSLANYAEAKILDHLVGKTSFTIPTCYIGLSTADPGEDASGLAEPSGGSYARVETAGSDWNAASGGSSDNAEAIAFPQASGSWGTITHFALFDAASGGNMLASGALSVEKTIGSGDTVTFTVGSLALTLT